MTAADHDSWKGDTEREVWYPYWMLLNKKDGEETETAISHLVPMLLWAHLEASITKL